MCSCRGTAVWCGPCIVMEKEVLPLTRWERFFNEHFVYVRWDYDDESEAMKALREKYDFNSDESHALPGYMVIDADGGDVVYRADSYMEPEVFLMMGRIALGHAETSIESLERFRSGERDVGFLNEFLGKFPLLFLADHFPADEQHRLVPVLLEAADSYLRQSCSPAGTIVWRPSVWTFW